MAAKHVNPLLPNGASRKQTMGSRRIDLHYAKLGIPTRWTWDRFTMMCSVLRVTHEEMASVVCFPHRNLKDAYLRNNFPGSTALLLTLIEADVMKGITPDLIANPIASLSDHG